MYEHMDEFCNCCRADPCICDKPNEAGYECPHCGRVPTTRELHNGSCVDCLEDKRAARLLKCNPLGHQFHPGKPNCQWCGTVQGSEQAAKTCPEAVQHYSSDDGEIRWSRRQCPVKRDVLLGA